MSVIICSNCHKQLVGSRKKCSGVCSKSLNPTFYCAIECQRQHWKSSHSSVCKKQLPSFQENLLNQTMQIEKCMQRLAEIKSMGEAKRSKLIEEMQGGPSLAIIMRYQCELNELREISEVEIANLENLELKFGEEIQRNINDPDMKCHRDQLQNLLDVSKKFQRQKE